MSLSAALNTLGMVIRTTAQPQALPCDCATIAIDHKRCRTPGRFACAHSAVPLIRLHRCVVQRTEYSSHARQHHRMLTKTRPTPTRGISVASACDALAGAVAAMTIAQAARKPAAAAAKPVDSAGALCRLQNEY